MDDKTLTFLRRVYREHYFRNPGLVEVPTVIASREFGYIPFAGGMIRHLSFKSAGELVAELVRQAPSSVFCSNATYDQPTLQMDEKGWSGAELIFDIDADSIPTPCKAKHQWWFCPQCHKGGMGTKPSKCPGCRGASAEQVHWSCRECLNAARDHMYRLVDFLTEDFGVDAGDVVVYFSGNRGYHAHVKDGRFMMADSQARSEIANYIKGNGLTIGRQTLGERRQTSSSSSRSAGDKGISGWSARVNLYLSTLKTAPAAAKKQQTQKLLEQLVMALAARIDESVTTDIHRVFRMPGTLHGNSGMLKVRVGSLTEFEPASHPVVLPGDHTRVKVYFCPEFVLKGTKFGPYDSSVVEIPIYAAVFLLARGLGESAG